MTRRTISWLAAAAGLFTPLIASAETVSIVIPTNAVPRVEFGARKLVEALKAVSLEAAVARSEPQAGPRIIVSPPRASGSRGEEFILAQTIVGGYPSVIGMDDSGALYGCLELAKRIRSAGQLPMGRQMALAHDKPVMRLRGACVGMQKTYILPGRKVYEYPYTPELFPWFYNKELWREYLDFLAEQRMNTLYLWNGHPFASLVRVSEYPYAVEVPEDVFQKNVGMFHWLTAECDRRGIWLVQMFYNLLVSKPFAEHHGLATQLAAPTPEALDYTRKSVAEFVKQYPHVGLLVCLGEALQGVDNQTRLLTETIIPGVKDGMQAAGLREQPPLVVRAHATDPAVVMPAAVKAYSNICTMAKYNGESLTTWEPRGLWQERHLAMSRLASNHVANVHILANLEPFRYGAPRFIRKCVQAARDRLGATGIHLYPLAYWNWPNSPDLADPPLKQWRRDWTWFEAWARYAWNPDVPEAEDRAYWIARLTECYGSKAAAKDILEACNDAGECAPRLLRRFGITEGNRQTLSLGMTLDELVNPSRYRPYEELWKSQSPPGERLEEYVRREWNRQPHVGETPISILEEVMEFSGRAAQAANSAAPRVSRNGEEYARLHNDIRCIRAMSLNYAAKVNAALAELRFSYSKDLADLEKAGRFLAESFEHYQALAKLTEKSYRFANSMQTSQRKIPFVGGEGGAATNYHWTQLVRLYQKELNEFQARVEQLRQGGGVIATIDESTIEPWPAVPFSLLSTNAETYTVRRGARVWSDRSYTIRSLAPELNGLTGIRFSHEDAKNGRYLPVEFEVSEPVRVLIGYFKEERSLWLQVPDLETAAHADERGGIEPVLLNAAVIDNSPLVNVHALRYATGRHKLEMIGEGSFIVLGVVSQSVTLARRDARRGVR